MNTVSKQKNIRTSDGERFAKLAELDEDIFHLDDLGNLWNIRNKNTLRKTLSRYTHRGLIFRIYKSFYSIKKVSELDPYLLGIKALHCPAYVTCESILFKAGVLNQSPQAITLVSPVSKIFSISGRQYKSRQMQDGYLFNEIGVELINGVRQASLSRAVADILYFNPQKYFDAGSSKVVNWPEVKEIIKIVGYKVDPSRLPKYKFKKGDFLRDFRKFINNKVDERVLNDDLNTLLSYEEFTKIRKVLKREVLTLLKDEIARCNKVRQELKKELQESQKEIEDGKGKILKSFKDLR